MKNLVLCLVLSAALIIYKTADAGRQRRFVGGQNAKPGEFPYVVSLRSKETKAIFCSGTIIHSRFVLTAGHCIRDMDVDEFYVVAGTTDLALRSKRYYVEKLAYHNRLNSFLGKNDIGLIKLKTNIKFSKYIQKIPIYNSTLTEGTTATVSAWGSLGILRASSRTLQYSDVTIISLKKCRTNYKRVTYRTINKRNICTYNAPDRGFCNGDSGGPLAYNGTLVGIVSWSKYCAEYPDVYTKVSEYNSWIQSTMKKMKLH